MQETKDDFVVLPLSGRLYAGDAWSDIFGGSDYTVYSFSVPLESKLNAIAIGQNHKYKWKEGTAAAVYARFGPGNADHFVGTLGPNKAILALVNEAWTSRYQPEDRCFVIHINVRPTAIVNEIAQLEGPSPDGPLMLSSNYYKN